MTNKTKKVEEPEVVNEKSIIPDSDSFFNMAADFLGLAQEMPYAHRWFFYIFFWSNFVALAILFLQIYFKSGDVSKYITIIVILLVHYLLAKKLLNINLLKRVNQK